ncbi:MAG: PilN domain-containing protein [Thiotrichaceae bacterium]|nr:PilN domain-containing protein [Thiotrichaceae bacterium]
MASLNLLPWREKAKEKSRKNFITMVFFAGIAGVSTVYVGNHWMQGNLDYQDQRNARIKSETKKLDITIADIKKLDVKRKALLDRIGIIDNLQSTRPSIVHLFDEMVVSLPQGVFLTSLRQRGNNIKITGKSESSARVSTYMDKLNASDWLSSTKLNIISKDRRKSDIQLRSFELNVTQLLKPKKHDSDYRGDRS